MDYSSLASLLTVIVVALGTIAAILGLGQWKKQMKGKVEYELARRLLHGLYDIRNAIDLVRTYRLTEEDLKAFEEQNPDAKISVEDPDFDAKIRQAGNRATWPKLGQALNSYKVDLQEAEVVWGKDAKEKLTPIVPKIDELWYANADYIEAVSSKADSSDFTTRLERRLKLEQVIYLQPPAREDKYEKEVDAIIADIEKYLRRFLNA